MRSASAGQRDRTHRQCGAAALEFALVLPVFLVLLYGIASYGMVFVLAQILTFAAEEGARAAIRADPADPDYAANVAALARGTVSDVLAWLPEGQRSAILGDDNENVEVTLIDNGAGVEAVRVTVAHASYSAQPIIPALVLPGLGSVPPLPERVGSSAMGRL